MQVIVYSRFQAPNPTYISVISPGEDSIEQIITKQLEPEGIPYAVIDSSDFPPSPYIANAMTVVIDGGFPTFSWDIDLSKTIATSYNAQYWQRQYNEGILGLSIDNAYQLQLAIATPPDERTADQIAAVEFMAGLNELQQSVQDQIDAALTGEEIIAILSQLG
jgi:hypothetical protein